LPPILAHLHYPLTPTDARTPSPLEDATPPALRHAAVLLLIFPRGPGTYFLLTSRPQTLLRHPGQVSLPGGAAEAGDPSLWHTALREAQEELGIRTGRIRPLGQLDSVPVVVSGYLITPFVAWNPVPPLLRPDAREVAEVVEVPLEALMDPSTVYEETWELQGGHWRVTFYRFGSTLVWGATARILLDLTLRLRGERIAADSVPGAVRPAWG